MKRYLPWVCALMLVAPTLPAPAGSGSHTRDIRYPTSYEAKGGPNGVVLIPTGFKTRRTGSNLKVESVGIAQNVSPDGQQGVQLRMTDGRTLVTRTGRLIKLDGVVYRTLGWQDGKYLLVTQSGTRRYLGFTEGK